MKSFDPAYINSYESGELDNKINSLYSILESCELCPRKCKVNRKQGEIGYCKAGMNLMVSSFNPHFGEERPLVGGGGPVLDGQLGFPTGGGSGTIFLTHCNLLCQFCQNFDISHLGVGDSVSLEKAADIMIYLQNAGCHNINFVSPTHYAPQLLAALKLAIGKGLKLPIVWNCGGYENVEVIKLLEGIVDIYMPDFKFSNGEAAKTFCDAPDYFEKCKESVKEMFSQVGDLKTDASGVALRGMLIRHLVMPNRQAGSKAVLRFIAEELSPNSYVNVMAQYRPQGKAMNYSEINCYPSPEEVEEVVRFARELGLVRGL